MRADSGVEDVEHERPRLLDPGLTVREGPRSLELDEAAQHAREQPGRVHLRVGAERVAAKDGLLLSSMASGCSCEIVSSGAVERAGSVVAAGTLTRVGAMGLRERREGVAAREPGDRAVDGVRELVERQHGEGCVQLVGTADVGVEAGRLDPDDAGDAADRDGGADLRCRRGSRRR